MRKSNAVPARILVVVAALLSIGALPSSAQVSNVAPRITQAINNSQLTVLRGNVHPMARPAYDRGAAPASLPMQHMLLVLSRSPQQETALETLLAQQQDRKSPNYHKWLTPAQFGAQFGPSDQDIATIQSWLESQGFTVDSVSKGRNVIEFSGDAGNVQSAFHTAIHRYVLPNGEQHWANATDPEIPAALAPVVAGIHSLNNFFPKPQTRVKRATRPFRPQYSFPTGCSTNITSTDPCYFGLGPADFDKIYNVPSSLTGSGETIAIVSDSDIQPSDIDQFRAAFGLPAKNFQQIETDASTDPGIDGPNSDEVEAILDAEWAGAIAPAAKIDLVVSASTDTTFGGDTSALYIIDNQLAPILSYSYGACELSLGTAGNQFYAASWQQAQAEGITVIVSTGDNGAAGCDVTEVEGPPSQPAEYGLEVNGLASTPYNLAVGATDFNDVTNPGTYWSASNNGTTQLSALGYIPEMTWNDTCTNTFIYQDVLGDSSALNGCNDIANQEILYDDYDIVVTNPVGGSGGMSNCTSSDGSNPTSCSGGYAKPTWQTGPGVPNDGKRDLPDLSLFGSDGLITESFYVDCEEDAVGAPCNLADGDFLEIGGTSASAQVMAGIMALIDQSTASAQGNINPELYSLASQQSPASCNSSSPASSCVFHDVTVGTIEMPCVAGSTNCTGTGAEEIGITSGYNAATGYDLATGLGSLNVANLANLWGPTFYLSSANPAVTISSPGQSNTLDVTAYSVNGFSGSVTLACSGLPSGATCTFAPSNSVSLTATGAGASASVTVTVNTTSGSSLFPEKLPGGAGRLMLPGALCILGFAGLFLICGYKSELRWSRAAAVVVLFSAMAIAAGCSGGGSSGGSSTGGSGGTPTGTTTVSVSGANGSVSSTMNFQLTVN